MCDYAYQYNEKAKEGMRFIPIFFKALNIMKKLRTMENEQRFYKLNIGDVLFVSLDIFEKLLNDDEGKFLKSLGDADIDDILKIKDKSIDKYLSEYEEVIRMALSLAELERQFKGGNRNGF